MQLTSRQERNLLFDEVQSAALAHGEAELIACQRHLCQHDLFYLLTRAMGRADIDKDWLFERCEEVRLYPDGHLDLWAREHYKSTIITFGLTIQDILKKPEITVGIFSHTKPIARGFLKQIKVELETNERLKTLFPDILYANPRKEAKNWSEENGITVKRKTNPKEATVEGWGLVDGQPTSKHFSLLVYDDVVTRESVTTPDQIKKTTEAWELSLNLGADGGKKRYIGTRYHFNDTYKTILERGSATPRIHPATDNGKVDGEPVLISKEALDEKRRDQGPYTFGCQMLLNPTADEAQGFSINWFRTYGHVEADQFNKYILVDPANEKRKNNDWSSFFVLGAGRDRNLYVLDMIRDRMNLTERTRTLFALHQLYSPMAVGYEQYGMQSDIQHIEYVQEQLSYRFEITPMGGSMPKLDRIRRLIPMFENGKIYFPKSLPYRNYEGKEEDLIKTFLADEYKAFPVMAHDDMLDCLARVVDIGVVYPVTTILKPEATLAEKDWMAIWGEGKSNSKCCVID